MSSSIGQNPTFLLSTTCNEMLSLMIENWMKNHLVSDHICNTIVYNPPKRFTKKMAYNVGLTFSVGNTTSQFSTSIEQDN